MDARSTVPGLALALLSVLAGCGGGGGGGDGDGGGGGGTPPPGGVYVPGVAYVADAETDQTFELYTAALDGSEWRRVSVPLALDRDVGTFEWSPDRSRLAYAVVDDPGHARALYVADPLGGGAVAIDEVDEVDEARIDHFEWSPDSQSIAYAVSAPDPTGTALVQEVRVASAFGGAPVVVSAGTAAEERIVFFDWAPDSSRLAYYRTTGPDAIAELWVAARDGSDRRVVSAPVPGGTVVPIGDLRGLAVGTLWSPDSQWLAYSAGPSEEEGGDLFVVRPDGSGNARVNGPLVEGGFVWKAAWAPDASRLAYVALETTLEFMTVSSVLPDGTGRTLVSDWVDGDTSPEAFVWSADSTTIAFVGFFLDADEPVFGLGAFVAPADGTEPATLAVELSGSYAFGTFGTLTSSPSGDRLAFLTSRHAALELRTIDLTLGLDVRVSAPVTGDSGRIRDYAWAPDGSRLAYLAFVDGTFDVFVSHPDGAWGSERVSPPLPTSFGVDQEIAWTPDSSRVVYRTDAHGYLVYELFATTADGSDTVLLSGPLVHGGQVVSYAVR
jgi:Tol biopolymer transport system component